MIGELHDVARELARNARRLAEELLVMAGGLDAFAARCEHTARAGRQIVVDPADLSMFAEFSKGLAALAERCRSVLERVTPPAGTN